MKSKPNLNICHCDVTTMKSSTTTNYDNFEDFVQENTGNRFKLISPIQARILTNEHPCHLYGT